MAIGSDTVTARITLNRQWVGHEPGHLWVYAGHVGHVKGRAAPGDLVEVIRPDGRRHGIGFFNPASKIMVRLLTFEDERIDEAFWRSRIDQAIRLRQRVVNGTNAYRLIFSEGDRLPGLIVDRYDHVLVMQTLSYGMDRRKDVLADILMQATGVSAVYLRNDAKSRRLEGLPLERKFLLGGGATEIEIKEGRARFLVDIERGQKTGWFCDQRGNRLAAAKLPTNIVAADARHHDVETDKIRCLALARCQRLPPIFCGDRPVAFGREDFGQPLPGVKVVFGNENVHELELRVSSNRAPPSPGTRRRSPPCWRARLRAMVRPMPVPATPSVSLSLRR